MSSDSVEVAIDAIRRGEVVVVVDDEDLDNEGNLIVAAEHATPDVMGFFVRHTSGLICATLTDQRADELGLPRMVRRDNEPQRAAFTVTVDYRHGSTSGISAVDRSLTARSLVDMTTAPADLQRPGHLQVLRARDGGVLKRAGHTEASVDLAMLAGLTPAGVLGAVVTEDGMAMARRPELERFAKTHGLVLVTVANLIRFRLRTERLLRRAAEARLPTTLGEFRCVAFESVLDNEVHLALVFGEPRGKENVLVRVHSECLTGDVFGSLRCDCGRQLQAAMKMIAEAGVGVVVYLRGHEGRGIGISHKLQAYTLQDEGLDTVDANVALGLPIDNREYGIGAQMLVDLGITTLRLLTNNPAKRGGLEGFGLEITERIPLEITPTLENVRYLRAKRDRLGHLLEQAGSADDVV